MQAHEALSCLDKNRAALEHAADADPRSLLARGRCRELNVYRWHHRNVPVDRLGVGVSVCLQCRDAISLYKKFIACGVGAKRPFAGNSMRVTYVIDPDGHNLYLESSTDAPEESVFADDR